MGGGLMQLVAYGAQDIYLTGNPQITFFKVVYRRHTNFSMECIAQTFNGSVTNAASNVTATIARNGDLISSMHLDVLFPSAVVHAADATLTYSNWTNNTGHALVDFVELEIGGQKIDKHYGHWLDVWNELTDHDGNELSLLNKHSSKNAYLRSNASVTLPACQLYVPLKFWFNRNPGLALPLIALQYHEVKVKLQTRATNTLINTDSATTTAYAGAAPTVNLWVDYIYLDTDERRRFAQQSHEYLIEQLQYQTEGMANSVKLNLNHPVKELVFAVQSTVPATASATANLTDATANVSGVAAAAIANNNDYFNYMCNAITNQEQVYGQNSNEPFATFKLQLNGHDRFTARNASYFRTVQPLQAGHRVPEKHVYNYSFALKPEEHQPSGTCNFSRIDNARMIFTGGVAAGNNLHVYAVNYNVLRVMSGMGGLAYSN
jgi:hypothetical protein